MQTKDVSKFDAYFKAAEDEPTFTLLARDRAAPTLVKNWAYTRERWIAMGWKPEADRAVVAEARRIAREMEAWYADHRDTSADSKVDSKLTFQR